MNLLYRTNEDAPQPERGQYHADDAPNNASVYLALYAAGYACEPAGDYRRHIHLKQHARPIVWGNEGNYG